MHILFYFGKLVLNNVAAIIFFQVEKAFLLLLFRQFIRVIANVLYLDAFALTYYTKLDELTLAQTKPFVVTT